MTTKEDIELLKFTIISVIKGFEAIYKTKIDYLLYGDDKVKIFFKVDD